MYSYQLFYALVVIGSLELARCQVIRNKNGRLLFHQTLPNRDTQQVGSTLAYFDQLIDHSNPKLGTFKQRYWYNVDHWGGHGHPIILFNAGEVDASAYTGYCTNRTISGMVAQGVKGAAIVMEHRYFGTSSPFSTLSAADLQFLTLNNSLLDNTYFANNVQLPFDPASNADEVPWVLMGGSYPGALSAYVASVYPGTFWAYVASSAPVQAISDFWQYFYPVQQGLPKNCSTDVAAVIDYMDNILEHGTSQQIDSLKAKFSVSSTTSNANFMTDLITGPWSWQASTLYTPNAADKWCDYVENAVNASANNVPGPGGVGLSKALDGYAKFVEHQQYLASQNTAHPSNDNSEETWTWILCNYPLGFWQTGAPTSRPSIVSRLLTVDFWSQICSEYFPPGPNGETYGLAKGATEDQVNSITWGWNRTSNPKLERIIFVNGEFDPWRSGSVASEFRPGGPMLTSTDKIKSVLIPGGVHCYDLSASSGSADARIAKIQQDEVAQIAAWVAEWPQV